MSISVLSLFKDGFGIIAEKTMFKGQKVAKTFENVMLQIIIDILKREEVYKFYKELYTIIGKRLQKLND